MKQLLQSPETNSSPLKIGHPKGNSYSNHRFSGVLLLVTGRVPTQTMRKKGEIPKKSHTFVLFDPPKLGKFNDPCLFASMFAVSRPCSQARSEGGKSSIEQVWAAHFFGDFHQLDDFWTGRHFIKGAIYVGTRIITKSLKQLHLKIVWLRHLHRKSVCVCVCVFFFLFPCHRVPGIYLYPCIHKFLEL